ncbi:MAG: purine-binding chemotaxis protein CheW, partial [Succinivibrio sp.]|nr:purine-binding chemotaxis protein CheW [Succinivibrio sp.]
MAGLIDSIEQKTGIVGQNRMEMLLFRLPNNPQLYGLNVFKILEIVHCPPITVLPKLHKSVIGVIDARDITSSVIDLSFAMGGPITRNLDKQLLLMTEYNKSIQGFVVNKVERIVDITWDRIKPAPQGVGQKSYLV